MAELLERAQALVAAGPHDARPVEIAAVHDEIWPEKAPVCPTLKCRRVLGVAYYSIQRWAEQQGAASDAPLSTSPMNKPAIRFISDDIIYTPHGLGISYSNANITPKAAHDIVTADPEAAKFFLGLEESTNSDDSDTDSDKKPTPLSRMLKEELVATYRTELGTEPNPDMLADDLRKAIADHSAA